MTFKKPYEMIELLSNVCHSIYIYTFILFTSIFLLLIRVNNFLYIRVKIWKNWQEKVEYYRHSFIN